MNEATATEPAYEGWAIVELMGHRQTAGKVVEVQMAGSTMLRIDTPGRDGATITSQFYGGSAIYCLTPCDETTARQALEDAYSLPPAVRLAIRQQESSVTAIEHHHDDDDDDDALPFQ